MSFNYFICICNVNVIMYTYSLIMFNNSHILIKFATKSRLYFIEFHFNRYDRANSPNSGCLLNIGNGPQSGPPLYSKPKGRKAVHLFVIRLKAAKWVIIPVFGKHPEFGEFTLLKNILTHLDGQNESKI